MDKVTLGDLENEWSRYVVWCGSNGLVAEFDEKFFDWMNRESV